MPKVIFFYMTWLASLVMGIVVAMHKGEQPPIHLGTIWMCIFAFNVVFTQLMLATYPDLSLLK